MEYRTGIVALSVFMCGVFAQQKIRDSETYRILQWLALGRASILAFVVITLSIPVVGSMEYGSLVMGNIPLLSFVIAVVGSLMLLSVSKLLDHCKHKQLLTVGGGTIVYLALHHPVMDVVKFAISRFGYDISGGDVIVCIVSSVMTIIACYPCLLFLEKYCPKMIEK